MGCWNSSSVGGGSASAVMVSAEGSGSSKVAACTSPLRRSSSVRWPAQDGVHEPDAVPRGPSASQGKETSTPCPARRLIQPAGAALAD